MPPPHTVSSLLDVGCGNGIFHDILHQRGYTNVTGIDFSEHLIHTAIEHHPYYAYYIHDICTPFPFHEQFDVITCIEVLEHVASPYLVLKNIYDILARGGVAVVSTPNALKKEIYGMVHKKWVIPKNVYQYFTPSVLQAMIREIGGVVEYTSMPLQHIFIKFRRL